MKQSKRLLVMMVATLLMATSVWAGDVTIITKLNGAVVENAGKVAQSVEDGICTLTVTPDEGDYIVSVTAEKTVDGSVAQGRFRVPENPSISNMLTVTGPDANADPSDVTTWSFEMPADDYGVEVVANFQSRTSIADAVVTLAETEFTYDGAEKKPAVSSVVLGTTTLTASTDYTFRYSNNVDAGTATVTVTGQGIYTGVATTEFTINKAALSDLTVSITGWTYGQYDIENNSPSVEGNDGNGNVTYTYADATAAEPSFSEEVPTNAGSYIVKATVVETANYAAGYATETFTIAKADITPTVNIQNWTYGDAAKAPSVTGNTGNGDVTYSYAINVAEPATPEYTVEAPSAAGNYIVKAVVVATANYNGAEATANFTIAKASLSNVVIAAIDDQTYTGDPIEPAITVTFKGNAVDASEYEVDYGEDNVDVGTVTVTLSSNDINFILEEGATAPSATFQIVAAEVDITAEDQTEIYNGESQEFTNYESDDVEVVALYFATETDRDNDENGLEVVVDAGTYYVKLVSGDNNYTFEPVYATFTIEPKTLTEDMLWQEGEEVVYTGNPIVLDETMFGLTDEIAEDEVDLVENTDYELAYANNTNVGTATVTITGKGNYQGTLTTTFKIVRQLDITFSETHQWATYYADENLAIPEGLKAYTVTEVGASTITATEINYIPQHQGVLLTYEEPAYAEGEFLASAYEGTTQESFENLLQGVSTSTAVSSIEGAVYVLYNNEFVKSTTGSIPAHRAYLILDEDGPQSRSLTIVIDESSGISEITAAAMTNGHYYNLQGMRMAQPRKGLVIVDGKKMFVK